MNSRLILTAIACATLCTGALPAFAQASGIDQDRINSEPQGGPAPRVDRPAPRVDARDHDRRDGARNEQQHNAQRQQAERRQRQQRDWDRHAPERRDYGYVVPRPYYYPAPPVYYPAPPVYYPAPPVYFGAVPQPYASPYATSSAPVFRAGDFLPPEYRSGQFVIADWDWRGLYAPPAGYQWMLLGADYALVAIATGQIVSVVTPQ